MSDLDTMMQLRAWKCGRAVETAEALPWPRVERASACVLAFVRMGGESSPWGFAIGEPGRAPEVHTVADPRNADATASLAVLLSDALLRHVGHPSCGSDREDAARKQLWLPGAAHLDALHLLALRFVRARHANGLRVTALRRLGRAAGWLFRESRRPGQLRVMDATAKLRDVFAFPSENVRQQHLGYLLSWLRPSPGPGGEHERARRQGSADAAERESVSWTLDPELEERVLEPLVEASHRATREGGDTAAVRSDLHAVLQGELLRRWKLTEEAYLLLDADPRGSNAALGALEALARDEFEWQYASTERKLIDVDESSEEAPVFITDPETDRNAAGAANRYWSSVRAADLAANLVHGDRWLLARAVAAGEAIEGVVRVVRSRKVGRAEEIIWEIACSSALPTKFREGSSVALCGTAGRTATVLSVTEVNGERVFTVEIDGWKNARVDESVPAANDREAYEGARVGFVAGSMPELARKKAVQAWKADGPGAWLTHSARREAPAGSDAFGDGPSLLEQLQQW